MELLHVARTTILRGTPSDLPEATNIARTSLCQH